MENSLLVDNDEVSGSRYPSSRRRKLIIGGVIGGIVVVAIAVIIAIVTVSSPSLPSDPYQRALKLMEKTPLIDSHNDLPWVYRALVNLNVSALPLQTNLSLLYPGTQTDIPRIKAGKLGGQIWSVYIACGTPDPVQTVMEQIDVVYRMVANYPDFFKLAFKSSDIVPAFKAGKFPSLMGMEGGHSINSSMGALRTLYTLGARYMTLTHSCSTPWAQSANDNSGNVIGLTEYGKEIVREMNRIGMMVDISHVAVQTMYDAINTSSAPVIFSHSNARALCDHIRNVPDDVLRLMPKNGGVVMVVFYPAFVCDRFRLESIRLSNLPGCDEACVDAGLLAYQTTPLACNTSDVADQIDYLVKMMGIDHVGIGSDYDGVDILPVGLEDVSKYPHLIAALIKKGYKDADIDKILSGNIIRVLREVEEVAANLQKLDAVGP